MSDPASFTADDLKRFAGALTGRREPGSYESMRWSVSALNRRPDIVGAMPSSVVTRDITLRTVEQMQGVILSETDRRSLLKLVVSAGVPEIITSGTYLGGRGPEAIRADIALVKEISPSCQVVYCSAFVPDDFKTARAAGYDLAHFDMNFVGEAAPMFSPVVYDRLWRGQEWRDLQFATNASEIIERAVILTSAGKDEGLRVSAGVNVVGHQNDGFMSEYAGAVGAAGADDIFLADSNSALGPEAYAHVVRLVKNAAPKVRVALHPHDMFGLALANSAAGVKAGAEVIEVSVNGYHLGYSQTDLAQFAVTMEAIYGVSTGIDLAQLTSVSRHAEEIVQVPMPAAYPVTGRDVFALGWQDPFVEEWFIDPLLHKPLHPAAVGNEARVLLTASTGPFGMRRILNRLRMEATPEQVEKILEASKGYMQIAGRGLTDDEYRRVAAAAGATP